MNGATFRAARARLGMTQTELALELAYSRRQVQGFECDASPVPPVVYLAMLALKDGHRSAPGTPQSRCLKMADPQNSTVDSTLNAWDGIITTGWGPGFAAGSILTWLRDAKTGTVEWRHIADPTPAGVASWYYRELVAHARQERDHGPWTRALAELWEWLTPAEHQALMAEQPGADAA